MADPGGEGGASFAELCANSRVLFSQHYNGRVGTYSIQNTQNSPILQHSPGGATLSGPISFIFMQFWAKILNFNRFLPKTQGLASPLCLGNPGSRRCTLYCLGLGELLFIHVQDEKVVNIYCGGWFTAKNFLL